MKRASTGLMAALGLLLAGCDSRPSLEGPTVTTPIAHTDDTRLGRAIGPLVSRNPGATGIHALPDPHDAFAARVQLAAAADRSLDVQYYIWNGDQTGLLLFEAIWQAAQRGVRVRLLLDDNNTAGLDDTIAALDGHPNIEVRLYNPLFHREMRALNYLTDFARLNRRMHNKSFTADGQAAIVGGRNVGNEYFGAGTGVAFKDLDVLAVGAAVPEVSNEFDLYWNSRSAYPASRILHGASPDADAALQREFGSVHASPAAAAYVDALRDTRFAHELLQGALSFEWTRARLLRDDPAKTLDRTGRHDVLLLSALLRAVGRPQRSFDLVSPYFVPGDGGTRTIAELARSGVKVRVLTNSLAATDVSAVHAGYAKRREALLAAGVRLYELKPTAGMGEKHARGPRVGGSSSASLHAKTFAVDGARIFVGSFNFDERSALLNTEMGLLIDSPVLSQRLTRAFDDSVPRSAHEVRLVAGTGKLEWIEQTPAGERRHATEPGAGFLKRAWVGLLSLLPIDWLL